MYGGLNTKLLPYSYKFWHGENLEQLTQNGKNCQIKSAQNLIFFSFCQIKSAPKISFLPCAKYTVLEIQFRSSYYTVVIILWKISSKTFRLEEAVMVKGATLEIYWSIVKTEWLYAWQPGTWNLNSKCSAANLGCMWALDI